MNRKTGFIVVVTIFFFTTTFSRESQSLDSDMRSIARVLIPEINDAYVDIEPFEVTNRYIHFTVIDDWGSSHYLKMRLYKRPAAATDFVIVDDSRMLSCFSLDRQTEALTATELPFELLPPSTFNNKFDDGHDYWRVNGDFSENGDIVITASPGMSYLCTMVAFHDGEGCFTLYKRAGYDFVSFEITTDDAEKEIYVQNVVRPNFQRINAITKWSLIEEGRCVVGSAEQINLIFYYSQSKLEKIVAKVNDKSNERVIEYYFLDGLLSFVYDTTTQSGAKSEHRWYLSNNSCFRGIGNNGKKLTPSQIEAEFLNDNGAYLYYTLFLNFIDRQTFIGQPQG